MRTPNALVLSLSLCLAAAQAVSWADCCCGSFCQHKNACTGCGPEDACPGGAPKPETRASCCDEAASPPQRTCSHQEPSSEIDSAPTDGPAAPRVPLEPLFLVDVPAVPDRTPAPPDTGPPRAGPQDALPRHLFLSVLRI